MLYSFNVGTRCERWLSAKFAKDLCAEALFRVNRHDDNVRALGFCQ